MKNLILALSLLTSFISNGQVQFVAGLSWKIGDSTLVGTVEYYAKRNIGTANAIPKENSYWTTTRIIKAPEINYQAKYDSVVTEFVIYKSETAKEIAELNRVIDSIIAPPAPPVKSKRIYTTHCMSAFIHHCKDLKGWMLAQQRDGINAIWVHSDTYWGYYVANLEKMFKVAEEIGMKIIPGVNGSGSEIAAMIKDSWNKPALLHINGKPVITAWSYNGGTRSEIKSILEPAGITEDDYLFIPHAWNPYSWDGGQSWIGGGIDTATGVYWFAITHGFKKPLGGRLQLRKLYEVRPEMDGYMSFGVDYGEGGSNPSLLIESNAFGIAESNYLGKYFFAGINGLYASAQYTNLGFSGLAKQWDSILILPVDKRPIGVSNTTTNDYKELSYMDNMLNEPVNGLSYIPAKGSGYNLGEIRIPLTDHKGMMDFCKPFSDAFLNDLEKPGFDTDRIFSWYWLHPKDAPVMPEIPQELKDANLAVTQEWWDNSLYAKDTYHRFAILSYMPPGMDNIRMGAHLTKPAYLQINNTRSALMPAGAAWFEIPMGSFRGTPAFKIINEDGTIRKQGSGLQPITDNRWPGGFNPLITEIK